MLLKKKIQLLIRFTQLLILKIHSLKPCTFLRLKSIKNWKPMRIGFSTLFCLLVPLCNLFEGFNQNLMLQTNFCMLESLNKMFPSWWTFIFNAILEFLRVHNWRVIAFLISFAGFKQLSVVKSNSFRFYPNVTIQCRDELNVCNMLPPRLCTLYKHATKLLCAYSCSFCEEVDDDCICSSGKQ